MPPHRAPNRRPSPDPDRWTFGGLVGMGVFLIALYAIASSAQDYFANRRVEAVETYQLAPSSTSPVAEMHASAAPSSAPTPSARPITPTSFASFNSAAPRGELLPSCDPRPPKAAERRTTVFQERGPDGRMRFRDAPGASGTAVAIMSVTQMQLSVETVGAANVLVDESAVRADVVRIGSILASELGLQQERELHLKIRLYANVQLIREAFESGAKRPWLAYVGFYRPQDQSLHVLLSSDGESWRQVLRHEVVHALLHERNGNVPIALHEGIAQYLERVQVAASAGVVAGLVSEQMLPELDDSTLAMSIVSMLRADGEAFYQPNRVALNYQLADLWVSSEMADEAGQARLAGLFANARAAGCGRVDLGELAGADFGGLEQLGLLVAARRSNGMLATTRTY
jgi:hypothetical protein